MAAGACLGTDTMVDLVEGRADDSIRARIETHASRCAACRELLSSLLRGRSCATGSAPGLRIEGTDDTWPTAPGALGSNPEPLSRVGRYVIEQVLGAGGMGVVFAARDPELGRRVALKLLRPDVGSAETRARLQGRLRREARAMAQLAHPNVVAVHDVGLHDDRIFIAMELVEGETLARWLASEARAPAAILEAFCAAGRGLAAAHAAGLVHRDFKPENVLVGADGRVRVVDFGLARAADDAVDERMAAGSVDDAAPVRANAATAPAALTASGAVIGTPYYMAPELYRGEESDARSDQFSFCVALYAALYGERPFAGDDLASLAASVCAGRLAEPPRANRVGRRVRAAIARGLATAPEDRFPSLDALLAAIAPRSRRRWLVAAVAAIPVAIAAVGAASLLVEPRGGGAPETCRGAAEHLRGVWDEPRKAQITAVLTHTGALYAQATLAAVTQAVDAYTAAWVDMRTSACEATRIHGEQSEAVLELRMTCLDERLRSVGAFGAQLAAADRSSMTRAVETAHALPALDACADVAALKNPLPLPRDADARRRADELRTTIAELHALHDAGRFRSGLAAVPAMLERAATLAYRPLEAEALEIAALLAESNNDHETAAHQLRDAATAALAGRHDTVLARVLVDALSVVGYRQARYREVGELRAQARAAIERLGNPPEIEASLLESEGQVAMAAGQYAEARTAFEAALARLEQRHGRDHLQLTQPLRSLGAALLQEVRPGDALPHLERALAIQRRTLGDDHPHVAGMQEAIGGALHGLSRHAEAKVLYERALAVYERTYGPVSSDVANVLFNLGTTAGLMGKDQEAIALKRRAFTVAEQALGAEHPRTLANATALADAFETVNQHGPAREMLERVLATQRKVHDADHPHIASTLFSLALVDLGERKLRSAIRYATESIAMQRRTHGEAHPVPDELRTIGEAHLLLGESAAAVAPLDRAYLSLAPDEDPARRAWVAGLLGRALVDSGRDPARGRALVTSAWRHMVTDDRMTDERADLAAWLKRRGMKL